MSDSPIPRLERLLALNSRQRIILHFLSRQPDAVGRTALMKWLFLFSRAHPSSVSSYSFVPYRFGPYSFEAHHNLGYALARLIESGEYGVRIRLGAAEEVAAATARIGRMERATADEIWCRYHALPRHELLDQVYRAHPWYATRSELAARPSPKAAERAVYTVGYEGRSVDAFFDALMRRGVEGVLDVRRHAYSQKYGFSAHTLSDVCGKLGLTYTHLPALGIESELRKDLSAPDARETLFDHYEQGLSGLDVALDAAAQVLGSRPTALMCFEATPDQCHRGRLAPKLAARLGMAVEHL